MYAAKTSVPVGRSQAEIKQILTKYGATTFVFGDSPDKAMVQFEMKKRLIKFILPIPLKGITKNKKGWTLGQDAVDQLTRSRWRALVISIKAKLEAVEIGITSFEQEFLAHIVIPGGSTVGNEIVPRLEEIYRTGNMPPLLGPAQ